MPNRETHRPRNHEPQERRCGRLSLLDRVISLLSASAALRRAIKLHNSLGRAGLYALRPCRQRRHRRGRIPGRALLSGKVPGVPVSSRRACAGSRAAAQDHVEAQWLLAALHIHGSGASTVTSLFSGALASDPTLWRRRMGAAGSRALLRRRTGCPRPF